MKTSGDQIAHEGNNVIAARIPAGLEFKLAVHIKRGAYRSLALLCTAINNIANILILQWRRQQFYI